MAVAFGNRSAFMGGGRFILGAALAALLAGCGGDKDKAPSGQVVATVNGEEITRTALTAEMAAMGIPPDQRADSEDRVLQQMIDRKVIAQAAKTAKMDQAPGFVVMRARANEALLAQSYVDRLVGENRTQPSQAEIAAYLAERPWIGRDRAILTIDQLRFPSNGDAEAQALVKRAPTLEGLAGVLAGANIKVQRGQSKLDTGMVPDQIMQQIGRLKPSEPLIMFGQGQANAIAVVSREAQATTDSATRDLARNRIIAARAAKMMEDRRASLRAAAKIDVADAKAETPAANASQPARQDTQNRAKF